MNQWIRLLLIALVIFVFMGIIFLFFQMRPLLQAIVSFLNAILGPFFIAMIISYLLHPIVQMLNARGVPRSLAVLLIYTVFIASLVILVINMLPMLEDQLNELVEHVPEWNRKIEYMISEYNEHGKELLPVSVQRGVEKALARLERSMGEMVSNIMSGLGGTIQQLFLVFIVPFLAFYMLKDTDQIERYVMMILPRERRQGVVRLVRSIDEALGNYIRGQFLVCLIVGLLAYFGYLLIGLPYPFLLAGFVAVFNIIPYLGPFIGAIPAMLIALTVSFDLVWKVVVINFIVQILEGNVISPQIVGRTMQLHPLAIMFALLVGEEIGGVFGLILAVPIFAAAKVIFEHVVAHYVQERSQKI
jgi:predicted PurR-regulated permease PerM